MGSRRNGRQGSGGNSTSRPADAPARRSSKVGMLGAYLGRYVLLWVYAPHLAVLVGTGTLEDT